MPQYPDIDALLRDAKTSLRNADALSASIPQSSGPAPVRAKAASAPVDNSTWGRVKRVAGYSPLPEDIGSQFADDVDSTDSRDHKALTGQYGKLDTLKSFLAGAGGGFLDTLRQTSTPAGLATTFTPEGAAGRVASGAGSAVFAGQGIETLMDDKAGLQDKAFGVLNTALGLHGAVHAAGPRPHVDIPPPRDVFENGNTFRRRPYEGESIVTPPPQEPAGLLGEPQRALPAHEADPSASFLAHQDDFNGGGFPLYNVEGGAAHGSTVTAETLAQMGIPVPETPAFTPPPAKPHITAPEFSEMLKGRAKFAEQAPVADLPPGAQTEIDRSGLEYRRTQDELKRLLGMPDADPREVARMKQGARELGSRLRRSAKDVGAPPATPPPSSGTPAAPSTLAEMLQASIDQQEAEKASRAAAAPTTAPGRSGHFRLPEANVPDDVYAKIRERKGIAPSPLDRAGREVGGGEGVQPEGADRFAAEYPMGDDSPFMGGGETGAISPDLVKMLARPAAGAAIGGVFGDDEHRGRDMAIGAGLGFGSNHVSPERLRYFSMLTGTAQAKNILGDIGVVGHTAAERALTHGPSAGGKVLKEFFSPTTAREYSDMIRGKEDVSLERMDRPESASPEGLMGLPFRTMGAADSATQNALLRAGIEDAADRTFTGQPKSDIGQAALALQRKGGAFARFLIPFMKTAVNQGEAGTLPFAKLAELGEMDPEAKRQALAKAGLLAAGGAAGVAYGTTDFAKEHPKASLALSPIAGPAAVPFLLGMSGGAAATAKKSPLETLLATARTGFQQLPLPSDWAYDPRQWFKSLAPAGLDLVNPDDVKRDTSGGIFNALISRIPGLSTTLPAKASGTSAHRRKFTDE